MTEAIFKEYRTAAFEYWSHYLSGDYEGRWPALLTMEALFRIACTVPELPFKLLELNYDMKKEVQKSMKDH